MLIKSTDHHTGVPNDGGQLKVTLKSSDVSHHNVTVVTSRQGDKRISMLQAAKKIL